MNRNNILIGIGLFMAGFITAFIWLDKKPVNNLTELEKDILYQKLRAKEARDSANMFLRTIQELSHRVANRDSATDKKIKYETVIIHRYDNAPSSKLDSFLRARYPDSITVARRGDR